MTRRKSGPKPRHNPEQILDAALDLLDVEGLAGFNMRALATRLELTPMALYRFFADKETLLAAMTAHAFPGTDERPIEDRPWEDRLAQLLRLLFDAFQRHPGALELILARVEAEGQFDQLREQLIVALRSAGFEPPTITLAISMLVSQLFGTVALENFRRRRAYAAEVDRERRLPVDLFPYLAETARQQTPWEARAAFEFGLERNIASLAMLLADRRG